MRNLNSVIRKTKFANLQSEGANFAKIHSLSVLRRVSMAESNILSNELVFEGIKEKSRAKYKKAWEQFLEYHRDAREEFENRMPTEDEFLLYFRHLRLEEGYSSSTMWTLYSMVNSVYKGKYGSCLQKHPRITSLLKSYDTDVKKKAAVFSQEEVDTFIKSDLITTPYWQVRKVIGVIR